MSDMSSWFAKRLGADPSEVRANTPPASANPPVPQPTQNPESLTEALRDPAFRRGGEASKTELASCPGCGSTNYFSRASVQAKPRCYDCGFPIQQRGSGA